jgi:pimeloyl-ACP methyl ester carboxylesterase
MGLSGPIGLLFLATDVAANPWTVVRTRAEMTGAVVADLIARTDQDRFVLIGHSLGARVMVKAAQLLGTRPSAPKIEAMHLLGAAVGTKGDWRPLNAAVIDKVWNYHSRNDKILSRAYPTVQFGHRAVGCQGFRSSFPMIVNKDVSGRVSTHSGYFEAVKLAS